MPTETQTETQQKLDPSVVLQKLDDIAKGVHDAQEVASRSNAHIAEHQAQIKSMSGDISKVMEDAQKLSQAQKGLEEYSKSIERIISRMQDHASSANGISEDDLKAKGEFLRYMRKGERLTPEAVQYICGDIAKKTYLGVSETEFQLQTKALVEGSDPNVGYFVRPQLSATIIQRVFETSPIRGIATIATTSSESLEMYIDDNEASDGGWVGEIDAPVETNTPAVGMLAIHTHEIKAEPKASQKMIDDAGFDLEAWLSNKVVKKISRTENTAFVSGNGSQKPKGFLSYPGWAVPSAFEVDGTYERGKLDQVKSGIDGDFGGDSVKILQNSLIEEYQNDAVWLMQRKTFDRVITLKDGVGRYLLNPDSIKARDGKILLGAPVIFASDMPAVAINALSIAYGDFKTGYTILDRIGIRVLRDPFTAKPFVLFYTTKRTGGDVTNYQCIKILKLAA